MKTKRAGTKQLHNGCPQTLTDRLVRLSAISAATVEDISPDVIGEFSCIGKELASYPREELVDAYREVCDILEAIAAARRRGESNYLFFMFLKLEKAISRALLDAPSQVNVKRLDREELYNRIISDDSRYGKTPFPDSLFQFIVVGQSSVFFRPPKDQWGFPDTMPVVFVLNGELIDQVLVKGQQSNVISGHCILGFEPYEDKSAAFASAISRGLLLHDVFVYDHVRTFAEHMGKRVARVLIALDTIYYEQKLYQALGGKLRPTEVESLVHRLAFAHEKFIHMILPQSQVVYEHKRPFKDHLQTIIDDGLLEFITDEVREYMGHDLRKESEKARALAYVAATYLYSPIILKQPVIAVESALNVEIPARIVLPYLALQNSQHMFSFVALFPLSDTKMSHGSMYYGNAVRGKIHSSDPPHRVRSVILEMSHNWVSPHRCWYVNYFLAKGDKMVDNECHPNICPKHQQQLIEDLLDFLVRFQNHN